MSGAFALAPLPGGRWWVVLSPVIYRIGDTLKVRIEAGTVTDLTSVPWFLRSIVGRWGRHGRAAVVHDALYGMQTLSRLQCDGIMRQIMEEDGSPYWVRVLIYRGLRLFGWWAWRSIAKRGSRQAASMVSTGVYLCMPKEGWTP